MTKRITFVSSNGKNLPVSWSIKLSMFTTLTLNQGMCLTICFDGVSCKYFANLTNIWLQIYPWFCFLWPTTRKLPVIWEFYPRTWYLPREVPIIIMFTQIHGINPKYAILMSSYSSELLYSSTSPPNLYNILQHH